LFPLAIVFAFQDGATRTGLQRAKGARKKRMRTFVIAGTSIELRLSIRLDLDQRSDTMLLNRICARQRCSVDQPRSIPARSVEPVEGIAARPSRAAARAVEDAARQNSHHHGPWLLLDAACADAQDRVGNSDRARHCIAWHTSRRNRAAAHVATPSAHAIKHN
jgi:hypothetical protein